MFAKFLKDESGATAIEYGILAALITVAIIATVSTLGTNLTNIFKAVSDKLVVPTT
ncbi:Flp family type IVb pilin [Pseudovibrio sp. WM33]|uniref:Flp family type IVb pilin n=1 Tax=Pseudovibrio sp. WM33 TaxID=1735585 RepID=UPI0007B2C6B8|nr:Flp family type IVb pilin [Pseudovibrio sp. WM33]KZL28331.1 Flp/Fap pilin component [Pseudovibrio sp. WM33]